MADEAISSGADLASTPLPSSGGADTSASPAPAGAEASETGSEFELEDPGSPDAPGGEDAPDYDALNDTGGEDPEAEIEQPVEEPAAEQQPAAETAATEELPEGVRKGKDRNGKDGFWLNPNRYETFHSAHKLLRDGEAAFGEPVTKESLQLRQNAFMAQERLFSDMLSGDPQAQGKVISYFFNEAQRAVAEGEVAGNPMVPFTQQFYSTLRDTDPDAYATLRAQSAGDLVDEMYVEAAQTGNRSLFLSAQHFDKILGREFKPESAMATLASGEGDVLANLRSENERLRAEASGRTQQSQAAQYESWRGGVSQGITQGLTESVINPALESVKASYKNYPKTFEFIQGQLHSEIQTGFKQDAAFRDRVNLLLANAKRAPSAQKRAEFGNQIVALHNNKARQIVEAVKAPILREAAQRTKAGSDATHQRRQTAQQQRAPGGGGVPVRQSLAPTGMDFESGSPENLSKSLAGLFR